VLRRWAALLAVTAIVWPVSCVADQQPSRSKELSAEKPTDHRDLSPVVSERHELFILAALADAYAGMPFAIGYNISAVIAWNVENEAATPDFIIERNRNYEKQGDIHHAEINTLRAAYDRKREFNVAPQAPGRDRYDLYKDDLKGTTLFTTLEPCPMCATTITMAKVPHAIYCMEDPGLRDPSTHVETVVVPTRFYNRALQRDPSSVKTCQKANQVMWEAHAKESEQPKGGRFSITTYLADHGGTVFQPGWEQLSCWKPRHPANASLLAQLQSATGAVECGKGPGK
jgi:tRNA(Arg) A34 adenosine deaminase TadA